MGIPVSDPTDDFLAVIEAAIADATSAKPNATQIQIATGPQRDIVRVIVMPRAELVQPGNTVARLAELIEAAGSNRDSIGVIAPRGRDVVIAVVPELMSHRFHDPGVTPKARG